MTPFLSRRSLLKGSAAAGAAFALGAGLAARTGEAAPVTLQPQFTEGNLQPGALTRKLMTYGLGDAPVAPGAPPPVLRLRKGEPFAARLLNQLDEPTTVHWHGLRVPNAMDGVPEMTQPYVYPGDSFDYAFTPPDAGTFWYHPHCNTLTQMGHGLTGVIVVEDPADPVFDAEIVMNLRDFRIGADGGFLPAFKPRDAARGGTYGTVRTTNWQTAPDHRAPSGGLLRLRIAATDVTRIYTLTLNGAPALIIALDGNPLPAPVPLDRLDLGPGQRVELVLRMPQTEGARVTLDNVRGSAPFTVAGFIAEGSSLKRDLRDVPALAPNPIAKADLSSAERIPLDVSATAEHGARESICGSLGYTFWAINKVAWPGDVSDPVAPLADLKLGRSYVLQLTNRTPHAHPMHLHGLTFEVLSASKHATLPPPTDTILLQPDEQAELAFVADSLGDWMFHCHIIEHQKSGMSAYLRVS